MKKIEEIKYKVGMSENEHNLACKLNELIKAHNEKEDTNKNGIITKEQKELILK